MLSSILLIAALSTQPTPPPPDNSVQILYVCKGHWVKTEQQRGSGMYVHVYGNHVTVLDGNGDKIGVTDDDGAVFKCESDSSSEDDDTTI